MTTIIYVIPNNQIINTKTQTFQKEAIQKTIPYLMQYFFFIKVLISELRIENTTCYTIFLCSSYFQSLQTKIYEFLIF